MTDNKKTFVIGGAVVVALLAAGAVLLQRTDSQRGLNDALAQAKLATAQQSPGTLTLTDQQLSSVKVVKVESRSFVAQRDSVGYIDFNQDRTVQVFSPWTGRIRQVFVKAGDDVKQGAPLYSIASPDLVQAQSTLIATAGVLQLTTKALDRAKKMLEIQANSQKDVDQAISDQQTAEANHKAARDGLRIFGKTEAQIDAAVASRKLDGDLTIVSPLAGRVTARSASPGMLVQPGTAPPPVTVADLSTVWMVASVTEYDLPLLKVGQEMTVSVVAYPGRKFQAKITTIGATVDPVTHRIAVRSEISDPKRELRPQMLATFIIRTGEPTQSIAVPVAGVVREGDGTMTVFVATDSHRFTRRAVQVGATQDGLTQIVEGLAPGESVASDSALFLSNALALQTR